MHRDYHQKGNSIGTLKFCVAHTSSLMCATCSITPCHAIIKIMPMVITEIWISFLVCFILISLSTKLLFINKLKYSWVSVSWIKYY